MRALQEALCELAEQDSRLAAVTPAMCTGSGMTKYAEQFPERFFDVGIAEQNLIDFSAGLALEGLRPFAVGLAAMVETHKLPMQRLARKLKEETGVPVCVGGVEAEMAILGALTTPGTKRRALHFLA